MYSLNRILEQPPFKTSPQLTAFLVYVVNEELDGRGELIKAYSVAVDALGRPDSFDPSSDPVIRVIATRLRKALDTFYDKPDPGVPYRIRLVRGSYRPVFSPAPPATLPKTVQAHPAPAAQTLLATNQRRRYHLIISGLLVLLVVLITYIVWDLEHSGFHTVGSVGVTPRIVEKSFDGPRFLNPRDGHGHFVEI